MAKRKSKTHPESFEQKGRHSTTRPITWAEERPLGIKSTTDHLKDFNTLQCTIDYNLNGLVTVENISWRASVFPKSGTYVKLYVLTEGKYRKKKKKTEVVYKVLYGERKFRKPLKIQCKEKDSLLILSVWKKELKSQPIARVCIQLRHMLKGRFYEERCPLKICTKTDVKTDNKAYFELNQDEPEEMDIEENQMTPATTQIIAASTPSTRSNTTPTGLQKRKESQNKRMEGRQSISEYNSSSNLRQQAKFQLPLVANQEKELPYDRSQGYRQNIDKGDKFQYVPRRSPSLPNTVTGRTLQRRQRLPSKIQGNNYSPHPPMGLPKSPIRSTRRNSRTTYPSSGSSVPNDVLVVSTH
ncbi:uncharacterized protein LOC117328540 [Pecten maximus]|uniref:uncharacterized protein LOC117328540 n=1 Tax=Pecten maximus TaxID=6579 RepID=UPI001458A0A4|nr:uncharacterized protein LOC117328540 [Pecten maximus]